MNEIRWIEVKINSDGELAEALAELLGRFASNGVVIESPTLFNPHTQENETTGDVAVSGYLAVDEHLEEKKQKLEQALWHMGQIAPIPEPEYSPVYDEDWMAAWKQHYTPIRVGDRILVMPAWHKQKVEDDRIIIRINPAMAFGTGTHPTTQLCLQLMEKHLKPGTNVIDIGCGSGILSIGALKMGALHALSVDIDNQAVTSTLENAGLNDIAPGVLEVGKGSVEEILTGRFTIQKANLVLVNILAPVILGLFSRGLGNLVSDDGTLLLSGILNHQEEDLLQTAEKSGFSVKERLVTADWVSFGLGKL